MHRHDDRSRRTTGRCNRCRAGYDPGFRRPDGSLRIYSRETDSTMSSPTHCQPCRARAVARYAAVIVLAGCSDDDPNEPVQYTLRVQGSGTGAGLVTSPSTSPGLSCSIAQGTPVGTCAVAYAKGTSVPLVAAPNAGSSFAGWSGACGGTGQCIVDMSGEQSVTATFTTPALGPFELTVVLSGQGSGTVSSTPGGVGCTLVSGSASGQCSATFAPGTNVTLSAAAVGGSTFGGWGGACGSSGTTATCTVFMGQPNSVTATFAPPGGAAGGAVARAPGAR